MNRPSRRLGLLLALLLPAVWLPAEPPRTPPVPNVVLIGWDGAQRAHVREMLARGALPGLADLASRGAMVDIDAVGVTDTKAGWSEILTGYGPSITGVVSNAVYRPIPEGYTIFERLRSRTQTQGVATVALIGKKGHVGGTAAPARKELVASDRPRRRFKGLSRQEEQVAQRLLRQQRTDRERGAARADQVSSGARLVAEGGRTFLEIPGEPYYFTHNRVDVWETGLELNDKVGSRALQELERLRGGPFFFFVHFAEVDQQGHKHGENSSEYEAALASCDAWTGRIVAKLRELGIADRTLVYVTADHGFDEGEKRHSNAPEVFLASNDPAVARGGTRADVAATVLARFGIEAAACSPPLTGRPLFD